MPNMKQLIEQNLEELRKCAEFVKNLPDEVTDKTIDAIDKTYVASSNLRALFTPDVSWHSTDRDRKLYHHSYSYFSILGLLSMTAELEVAVDNTEYAYDLVKYKEALETFPVAHEWRKGYLDFNLSELIRLVWYYVIYTMRDDAATNNRTDIVDVIDRYLKRAGIMINYKYHKIGIMYRKENGEIGTMDVDCYYWGGQYK